MLLLHSSCTSTLAVLKAAQDEMAKLKLNLGEFIANSSAIAGTKWKCDNGIEHSASRAIFAWHGELSNNDQLADQMDAVNTTPGHDAWDGDPHSDCFGPDLKPPGQGGWLSELGGEFEQWSVTSMMMATESIEAYVKYWWGRGGSECFGLLQELYPVELDGKKPADGLKELTASVRAGMTDAKLREIYGFVAGSTGTAGSKSYDAFGYGFHDKAELVDRAAARNAITSQASPAAPTAEV